MVAFVSWRNERKYGCHGECFDVGFTTDAAIKNYEQYRDYRSCGQKDEFNCGNGSLMRMLPLPYLIHQLPIDKRYYWCEKFSSLTHAHPLPTLCCFFYVEMYIRVLEGKSIESAIALAIISVRTMQSHDIFRMIDLGKCSRILNDEVKELDVSAIKSTGYVVDTLEAVIWSLLKGASHLAVTLGNDTDTTAALVGGIAAIKYPEPFPLEWMGELQNTDLLISTAAKFIQTYSDNFQEAVRL